jgi:ribose 5-phosphate isomerase B
MVSIAIASDHEGFEYKEAIKIFLESKGIVTEDFGTFFTDLVDYPEFVRAAAVAVATGQYARGIILGGSGNEAIVAN